MKMRFHNVRYNNVRNFKDFEINIENGCNHFSAEDDTGLMDILKILLSGKSLERSEVHSLRPKDERIKEGYAELTMDIDMEMYTIRLDLDYAAKKSCYHVTARKDNGIPKQMLRTPSRCRVEKSILDIMMQKRDDVEGLFEKGSSRAEVIINSVSGIDKINLLRKKAQTLCENENRKHSRPAPDNNGVTRQNTLLSKYRLVEMNLERYRDELYVSIAGVKNEQNSMIGRMGGLVRRIVESQLSELSLNHKSSGAGAEDLEEIIFALRYPLFFSEQISGSVQKLQSALEDMKYPVNSIPAPIRNIATSGMCICGTEVNEGMIDNISNVMERYSLQHPYFMINEVRSSVESFSDGTLFNYYLGKSEMEASKKVLTGAQQNKPTKSKILEATVLPEITIAAKTMNDLKIQIDNLRSELLFLTDIRHNNDPQSNIPACRQKIRSASLSKENADRAQEFKLKTELFVKMLDEIYHATFRRVKDELLAYTNSCIASLSANDPFIEDINGCLIVDEKDKDRDMKCIFGLIFFNAILKDMDLDMPLLVTGGFNEAKKMSAALEPVHRQIIIVNNQLRGNSVDL